MTPAALLQRWLDRLRGGGVAVETPPPALSAAPPPPTGTPLLAIDEPAALAAQYPHEYPIAQAATRQVIERLPGLDLSSLARRSPSLAGYDWQSYLNCSLCRVVRFQKALREHVPPGGRVLDLGSYFGNMALASRAMGYAVDAIDSYRDYGAALAPFAQLQRDAGIGVFDFSEVTDIISIRGAAAYDAVMCAGVIEHIPHTPRLLLESIRRVLNGGGTLILDTPNLAYLYKRRALLDGDSVFAPISQQFYTEVPFEGHHREYTVAEVEWILNAAGFDCVTLETFNYSMFGQSQLTADDAVYYYAMQADPTLREVIFAVGRRRPDV
jgi:2-polyprenyl-3-methyl-5-hydroxy-6-metoxy-1,4-benzoquinol methylase